MDMFLLLWLPVVIFSWVILTKQCVCEDLLHISPISAVLDIMTLESSLLYI